MNTAKRREEIARALAESNTPLSATALASRFSVSRQIVVGDIALLRAGGLAVLATPRGYILETPTNEPLGFEKTIVCTHDDAQMAEELYTIVDLGGGVLDVTVEHSVYGELCAPLRIFSRYDADLFLQKIRIPGVRPLCDLTDGVHLHRVRCADESTFTRIERALLNKKLLLSR